jgi:hypothetical protein
MENQVTEKSIVEQQNQSNKNVSYINEMKILEGTFAFWVKSSYERH